MDSVEMVQQFIGNFGISAFAVSPAESLDEKSPEIAK